MKRRWGVAAAVMAAICFAVAGPATLGHAAGTPVSGFDATFGTAGTAVVHAGNPVTGWAGAVQSTGKAIVAGHEGDGPTADTFLARLNDDGSLDTSFGNGGTVTTDASGVGQYDIAQTITVQPDDAIVVGGSARINPDKVESFVARYTPDGVLDTSFGSGGIVRMNVLSGTHSEQIAGIALDASGGMLITDDDLTTGGFALVRLTPDGTRDASFVGPLLTGQTVLGYSITVAADGQILVGGSMDGHMAVWRFAANGKELWWAEGVAPTAGRIDIAYGLVIQPDGSIVLAGGRGRGPKGSTSDEKFALERLTPYGAVDTTFGVKGVVGLQLTAHDDEIEALVQEPDGDLTAVGDAGLAESNAVWTTQMATARFTDDGVLDKQFGSGGIVRSQVGGFSFANAAAVLPDGRVFAFGETDAGGPAAMIVRYTAPPARVAFVRSSGVVGDTVRLIGSGFTPGSTVAIGSYAVPSDDISYVSPYALDVTIPDGAVTAKITVASPAGTVVSAKALGVRPRIDALDGDTLVAVGSTLGLDGKTFVGVTSVKFGGVAATIKSHTATHLTVAVPHAAVTGALTVTNAGGTTAYPTPVVIKPSISSITPASAPAGALVTVTGTGLLGSSMSLGGEPTAVSSGTGSQVKIIVPEAARVGDLVVHPDAGPDAVSTTIFKPLPRLTSISHGAAGSTVTITGTNLADASVVMYAGVAAAFTQVSALQLTATIPGGHVSGVWKVVTPGGTTERNYVVGPDIDSVTPNAVTAGSTIQIAGSGFVGVTAVAIGSTRLFQIDVKSSHLITAVVAMSAFSGTLTVTTPGGLATGPRVSIQPTVTSMKPTAGPEGAIVGVNGSGLGDILTVTFDAGSADAITVPVRDGTTRAVEFTVPPGAQSGPVELAGRGGSVTIPSFDVSVAITGISPSHVMPGDTVTVTGHGLSGVVFVQIGGVAAEGLSNVTDTSFTVVFPSLGAPVGTIWLDAAAGLAHSQVSYSRVTLDAQQEASQHGGTLDLTGASLDRITTVWFTGTTDADGPDAIAHNSDGSLTVDIPPGAKTGPIQVFDGVGGSLASGASFEILGIDSLSEPAWAPGDTVTVTGTGLKGGTVKLDGETAVLASKPTEGSLTFVVPADATDGDLVVSTPLGTVDYGPFDAAA